MGMKLGMEHYLHKLYKEYITDDPELTLTYFTIMSNLAKLVFVRPRYQVSVYRTIGPLDHLYKNIFRLFNLNCWRQMTDFACLSNCQRVIKHQMAGSGSPVAWLGAQQPQMQVALS